MHDTHVFLFDIVKWRRGMQHCLLCVVEHLRDVVQRLGRALDATLDLGVLLHDGQDVLKINESDSM